jgi:predicted permease
MLLFCILIGILLRQARILDERASPALNRIAIFVALPAVAMKHLHSIQLSPDLAYLAVMPWAVLGFAWVAVEGLGRYFGWSGGLRGALILTAGLGNTSFLGFPLLELIYGPEAIRYGIVVDQGGTFLALSFLGVAIAQTYSSKRKASEAPNWLSVIQRVIRFPSFIAAILAIALRPWPFPPAFEELLRRLSDLLVPLALLSVGLSLRLDLNSLRRYRGQLAWGLGLKMLAAPALIAWIYGGLFGFRGPALAVSICEASMAPMITASLMAQEAELEPELAVLMMTVGIPLSFVTTPAWAGLIRLLGWS